MPLVREVIIGAGTRPLTEAWRPDAATCSNRDACSPLTVEQSALKLTALKIKFWVTNLKHIAVLIGR